MRSAFWRIARYGLFCHLARDQALQAGLREGGDAAPAIRRRAAGWPSRPSALASASAGSSVSLYCGSPSPRPRVGVGLRGDVARDFPARLRGRGVEPAREVPAGDVRRVEQLLPGARAQPRPGGRVDRAADRAQQAGVVDDRRRHELGPVEEVRVLQDRLDDRPDARSPSRGRAPCSEASVASLGRRRARSSSTACRRRTRRAAGA